MQIIKVTKFCMVCCLKSIYFAIVLLPLISAENLTNGTSATSVYQPWKTISSRVPILVIVRNISHQYITAAVETGTFATIYNVYFFLYVHQHLRRSFHNKTRDTTNYIICLNNSKNFKENEDKYEDYNGKINEFSRSLKQYWKQKELSLKSRRDIAGVKSQLSCDDIFELALCMITAIFIEVIPITIRYACKKTALCWRRLFCCFYHRNYTKTPYLRQYLHQQHRAVINCVCDVLKLSTIKFKRRSDQQQKHLCILHQKHLTVFAVITGKIFALFIQGASTQSPEISVPAIADSLYISGEKLIIFPAVPTMMATTAIIAQNCKKFCHHYLLKAVIINPITFSFYAQITADHVHCIIMPKEIRLLPKQITYLVWEIQQLRELDISCDYKYFVCGGKIIENKFVYAANENKDQTLRHNLRSFAILLLLIDYYDTVYENYDNNYAKSQKNCYLKLFEEQLLKISKDCGILSIQMNSFIIGCRKKVKYGRDISVIHTNSIFKELQSGAKRKSKPNFGKHIKPMKLRKASPYWNVPFRSASTFTCQRIQDKSTNWKECLQAIIKFDLCCCCWCFYCYRRNSISERVSNGFCNKWYRCYPWYRRQYAYKFPHCIYCYYYLHCYYSLNQYCCYYCYSKFFIKSVMYPCNCSSNKSNHDFRQYCPNTKRKEKKTKEQRVLQQLKCFRNFFRPQYPTNTNCISSTLSALYFCHRIYWFQNTQNCCSHITKANTLVNAMNSVKTACAETISNKKIDFFNSIRSTAIYLGKCVHNELIKLEDYIRRHIVLVLQIKISIPRSTALAIKVTRDQLHQQQQQMVNIAHDQQLKMNYLCKIFCNNWKRHRRRKRRRRRRRMNKQEQQQHQSVRLQQQHINNEKETLLSGMNNSRLHILDFNACKAIATNVPVHMILSKAPTVTMLAAMRFTNTKIALTDGNRKDVISPSQTPALISSPSLTTTASTRLNRSRSRPNLVWLFIGLVWFEGPKYVNCGMQSSSQSSQSNPQSQSQPQTATHTAEATLEPLPTSVLLSQRQQHKIPPPRITSNLLLLTPNHKQIFKGSMSFIQKGSIAEIADTAKYKIKQGTKSSLNSKVMHIDNCLLPPRRASITATKTKGKLSRSYDNDPIMLTDRKRYNWLEPGVNVEANFLDEEAHSAHSDHARLESIKRQILTKLGLKQKPNVSHPLPKQFIWDTIYRADGIRSVVSDFDFGENGSHRMELMSEENSTKETRRSHSAKANDITNLLHNSRGFHDGEFANTIGSVAEKVFNVSYNDYLHHARFDESKILNDSKITNNFTYLMHISKPKPNKNFLGVDEPGYSDIYIYNDKDDLLETETDELNHKVNHGIHNAGEAYSYAENENGYSLHHRKYPLSADQNKNEGDDFLGDTQELIIFAEKGKMIKQHRLVEFAPQTKYMSNEKFFVRKAEIHIRIDKLATGCNDNANRKNRGCGGNKTKPKLWIFQVMENNTTKKSCDNSPQLCVTYDVDIMNLGWQKFDITLTVRDWYTRAPTEKLRLLIDCTGCGKHYILHLFNQPLENSKQKLLYLQREKRYRSVKRNDLVVHWRQPRLNSNIISERHSDVKERVEQRPKAKISLLCNNIFNCKTKKNFTSKIDNYKLNNVRTKLFRPHVLLGYSDQSNRLQPQVPQARSKPKVNSQPQKYTRLKISSELSPNRPFLVLRTETRRLRRVRRRAIDCIGAIHGQCCKESFYVSFKALGWDDWIIAPRGYFANYCRGDCTGPFRTPDTFQTFHAHFIEEYRKMGLLNGMQPCCAPVKFSSMSLIYYGDDGIIKRDLPKMVVDECGCP